MQLWMPCECDRNQARSQLLCVIDWIFLAQFLELRLTYMCQPLILQYYTLILAGFEEYGKNTKDC